MWWQFGFWNGFEWLLTDVSKSRVPTEGEWKSKGVEMRYVKQTWRPAKRIFNFGLSDDFDNEVKFFQRLKSQKGWNEIRQTNLEARKKNLEFGFDDADDENENRTDKISWLEKWFSSFYEQWSNTEMDFVKQTYYKPAIKDAYFIQAQWIKSLCWWKEYPTQRPPAFIGSKSFTDSISILKLWIRWIKVWKRFFAVEMEVNGRSRGVKWPTLQKGKVQKRILFFFQSVEREMLTNLLT